MPPSPADVPVPLVLLVAAIMLVAESGLFIGVVLPGATVPLSLGVLSQLGSVGFVSAVLTVAAASLLGSQLSYLAARRRPPAGFGMLSRWAEPLVRRASTLLARRPAAGAAAGRMIGGVRTVVPIVAARAGVRNARLAAGDVPAALLWAAGLVGLGHGAGAALDEARLAVGLLGLPLLFAIASVYYGLRWVRSVRSRLLS
jgi:membrane-associated protein